MSTGNGTLCTRRDAGETPEASAWGADSEYGVLRDVLLGPAESFRWTTGNAQFSALARAALRSGEQFDQQLAMRQHREMVECYEDAGVRVHTMGVNQSLPLQVFARDSNFMTPYGGVVCQLANPRRRGEYAEVLRFYLANEIPLYELVSAGNFEGGDFNTIRPGCALIGYTGLRTEEVAARQVGGWFEREGWEIRYAPIDEFYVHIDLMVCMLAENLAAVCLDTTDTDIVDWLRSKNIEVVPVSFRDTMGLGCNVMALGNDKVLSTASSKELNGRLRALGFEVYDPDISMFIKGGGGIHCLAQPLRRDSAKAA